MNEAVRINFLWLLRLRWGAVVGQGLTILGVEWLMGIELPSRLLFTIIAIETVSNAAFALWAARGHAIQAWMLGAIMAADVGLLTGLLYLTGGAFNPFSFLYLVHIALAAVVMTPRWTWALVLLSLACFGSLFLLPEWSTLVGGGADMHAHHMHMHLQGMWVAFAVAATFIVYFVQRVTRALAKREQQLSEARDMTARNDKLASLATLAAGAAHELSTPLSTIAVVAKELQRQIERDGGAADAIDDARLIREQVARCREILVQMTADAGETMGEASESISVEALVHEAVSGLPDAKGFRLFTGTETDKLVSVPRNPVVHAIRNVLKNAREASRDAGAVDVRTRQSAGECCIEVTDLGAGMPSEILDRAGEPFFTTKEPGQGMGLGLFLSRAVFARLGGRVELDSSPGRGTTVRLFLPLSRAISERDRSVNRAA